jgi:signal transduction histidine kinase
MSDEHDQIVGAEGVVRWFDDRLGYGFIAGPDDQDIFAHYTSIVEGGGGGGGGSGGGGGGGGVEWRGAAGAAQGRGGALRCRAHGEGLEGGPCRAARHAGDRAAQAALGEAGPRPQAAARVSRALTSGPMAAGGGDPGLWGLWGGWGSWGLWGGWGSWGAGGGWLALAGFGVGVLLTAAASFWAARRQLDRIRRAERRARAAERMAEIGAMTGGLAHEIKNPLSTIGLNAQLLAEAIGELPAGQPITEEERGRVQRRIGTLRREADRLRDILEDFLTFAGELHLARQPADLNQVVEELVDFFLPQAERQGVRLRLLKAPAPAMASVDERMVKQALLNLMLNAVRAMEDAPSTPSSPNGRPRELLLRIRPGVDDDRRPVVAIHVADTGPGIPPDAAAKIFQPYFTTRSGGSGLGLPTARRIVEAHGGRLTFTSEPGQGAQFVAEFPVEGGKGVGGAPEA